MIARIVTTIVCAIGLLPCLWFVIGYWVVTGGKWIREEAGQFLMFLAMTIGGMFTFSIAYSWTRADWLRWISIFLFIAFIVEMWWPLRLLWLAQRERRANHEPRPDLTPGSDGDDRPTGVRD